MSVLKKSEARYIANYEEAEKLTYEKQKQYNQLKGKTIEEIKLKEEALEKAKARKEEALNNNSEEGYIKASEEAARLEAGLEFLKEKRSREKKELRITGADLSKINAMVSKEERRVISASKQELLEKAEALKEALEYYMGQLNKGYKISSDAYGYTFRSGYYTEEEKSNHFSPLGKPDDLYIILNQLEARVISQINNIKEN